MQPSAWHSAQRAQPAEQWPKALLSQLSAKTAGAQAGAADSAAGSCFEV